MSFDLSEYGQAHEVFIEESQDLLQQMEDILLSAEEHPPTADDINAMFRVAHTIKGSAGLFGLDHIVKFTHTVENLLDKVRSSQIELTSELVSLLLKCRDYMGLLIEKIQELNQPEITEHLIILYSQPQQVEPMASLGEMAINGKNLCIELKKYLENTQKPVESTKENIKPSEQKKETQITNHAKENLEINESMIKNKYWHISLRFGQDTFRNGMDPASFLRYLNTFGQIIRLTSLYDNLSLNPADFDPESCYLGFELDFDTQKDFETINGSFDFVREDCEVRIIPPYGQVSEYIQMIDSIAESEMLNNKKFTLDEIKNYIVHVLESEGSISKDEVTKILPTIISNSLKIAQEFQNNVQEDDDDHHHLSDNPFHSNYSIPTEDAPRVTAEFEQNISVTQQKTSSDASKTIHTKTIHQSTPTKSVENKLIRVQAEKLDQLINLVGELVIAGASANLLAQRSGNIKLFEATSGISRLVEEIRDGALQLRMVQIGDTFNRFNRVVRDVSHDLNKEIELLISGGDTELDKSVIEKIGDPLMHLVRNAIDHGIELPNERVNIGKPAKGTLKLNAYHDSGNIVIEVSDNGKGLNYERILEKAREKGIIKASQNLTEQEALQLIFEPGFSTASQVTNLSGRGVGMDVVRRNIETLRGTVELESQPNVGTTVRIRLPLTLAIIDGFLVSVDKTVYVVPLDLVQECIELNPALLQSNDAIHQGDYINLRDEVLPFIRLRQLFNLEDGQKRRENIVVVQYLGQKAGLVVDELMGEYQTVIKPLGKLFKNLRGVSGATILGTGDVALILDIQALVQRCIQIYQQNLLKLNRPRKISSQPAITNSSI